MYVPSRSEEFDSNDVARTYLTFTFGGVMVITPGTSLIFAPSAADREASSGRRPSGAAPTVERHGWTGTGDECFPAAARSLLP